MPREAMPWQCPSTNVPISSGSTASSFPPPTARSACSRTACITPAPCSKANAPMAARSSRAPSIPSGSSVRRRSWISKSPISVAEIEAAKRLVLEKNNQKERLCAGDRLARLRAARRLRAEQHHPSRRRHLGMAELFRSRAATERHPARPRRIPPARSEDRAVRSPRRRPLRHLHHLQAPRRAPRLCRRA